MREPLRRLLTTLELDRARDRDRGLGLGVGGTRKVLITSTQEGEGKSLVVCNLALVARDAGLRVGVVDTDLLAPAQSKLLGVNKLPGLSDVLAARVGPHDAWQRVDPALAPVGTGNGDAPLSPTPRQGGEIQVLASGTPTPNPSAPIGSPAMPSVLSSRDGELDYVFVDAPPPLAVSDALPLLSSVDVIVVVSRLGHTTQVAAQRLNELFERQPQVPVLGIVANGVPEDESEAFGFVLADRYAR
jgi:Mrp family chromosome partitioning ATPase